MVDQYLVFIVITVGAATDIDDIFSCFGSARVLSRGIFQDGVYTNQYAGLVFTLPDGWLMKTDQEMADELGVSVDAYNDPEKWGELADKEKKTYDAIFYDTNTDSLVTISLLNLPLVCQGRLPSKVDYIKSCITHLELDTEPFEKMIGSKAYTGMLIYDEQYGVNRYAFAKRQDKFMLIVTVNIGDDVNLDDILGCFE
jgi:hypothetical protein